MYFTNFQSKDTNYNYMTNYNLSRIIFGFRLEISEDTCIYCMFSMTEHWISIKMYCIVIYIGYIYTDNVNILNFMLKIMHFNNSKSLKEFHIPVIQKVVFYVYK